MKRKFVIVCFMLLMSMFIVLTGCSSGESSTKVISLKAATNEQQTSAYIYTAALAEEVRNDADNPMEIEVLPYSGGIGNAELVDKGEADIGIMFNISSNWAYNGTVAYDKKHENIRGLVGGLNDYYIGIIARTDFLEKQGINSLADIKEKKIPVNLITNPRGSLAEYNTKLTLEAYGMDYEMIESFGGSVEFTSNDVIKTNFQDGKSDLHIMALGRGHQVIAEIATMTDITIMGIENEYHNFFDNLGYDTEGVFPSGQFKGVDYEINTPGFYVTYIVNKDMDEDVAYALAKAVNENVDSMVNSHKAMADFIPENAGYSVRNGNIPLHPGAEKFYKEIGAID